jgi:hypothetical protein
MRCQMSDVRCQMSDVRCQMSDVRCQIDDFKRKLSGKAAPPMISDEVAEGAATSVATFAAIRHPPSAI